MLRGIITHWLHWCQRICHVMIVVWRRAWMDRVESIGWDLSSQWRVRIKQCAVRLRISEWNTTGTRGYRWLWLLLASRQIRGKSSRRTRSRSHRSRIVRDGGTSTCHVVHRMVLGWGQRRRRFLRTWVEKKVLQLLSLHTTLIFAEV